jgi:hypothetical protein
VRARLIARHEFLLENDNENPWSHALGTLETLLAEPAWSGCDITAVLSSHYVHYAVIPKGRGLATTEQDALTKLLFGMTFGDLSRDWVFRISPAADGMPTLASGVPQPLLDALRAVCDGRGSLRSIQPGLMSIFNRTRPLIDGESGILVLVESGRTTLASIEQGQWHSVISRAGGGTALPQLLAEDSELHGGSSGGMLWLCDLVGDARLPVGSSWRNRRLVPPGPDTGVNGLASLASWGVG